MPKEKPPRFPVGLTFDQAVARGWRPGLGRPLIATDDGPIREVGPDDVWVDPVDRPLPRRRRPSGGRPRSDDSPRARMKAALARWRAAERERKRKRRRCKKTATRVRLLPAPEITIMPNQKNDQWITVEIEFTLGVVSMFRKRGFLTGEPTPSN